MQEIVVSDAVVASLINHFSPRSVTSGRETPIGRISVQESMSSAY